MTGVCQTECLKSQVELRIRVVGSVQSRKRGDAATDGHVFSLSATVAVVISESGVRRTLMRTELLITHALSVSRSFLPVSRSHVSHRSCPIVHSAYCQKTFTTLNMDNHSVFWLVFRGLDKPLRLAHPYSSNRVFRFAAVLYRITHLISLFYPILILNFLFEFSFFSVDNIKRRYIRTGHVYLLCFFY